MKLKKLFTMAYCVIIAAMGITLTGCNVNVRDVLDEISSVVNEEIGSDTDHESSRYTDHESSSDTDHESSSDTNTENSSGNENNTDANTEKPKSGTWVQTETRYFAYENGEQQYVSRQNEYFKYRCYYRGVTEDNFVKFQVSGGLYSIYPENSYYVDSYHLCSIPDTSYPAGGLVTLTANKQLKLYARWKNNTYTIINKTTKNYEENSINGGHGGHSDIGINYEIKDADGKEVDPFVDPTGMWDIDFYSDDGKRGWIDRGESNTFTAKMPEEAEIGDRIAILFSGATAYDSWSSEPQNDYGGYVWYAWIYTYTENA